MTEKPKLKIIDELNANSSMTPPSNAPDDIEELFLDPKLGDGITDTQWHDVPLGKPKNFFRVHPDPKYRRRSEIYVHKVEGEIGEEYYLIGPKMRGRLLEARPCTVCACMYRDGTPRLWALIHPREGEKDNAAWSSARKAANAAIKGWVKLVWGGRSFKTLNAEIGYAPDPDWSKLPSFNELIQIALGEHGIIRDENHPVYRDLVGAAPKKLSDELEAADDTDDI
jgi:hypothetical protein